MTSGDDTILVKRAMACWENGRIGKSSDGLVEARSIRDEALRTGDLRALAEANRCIGWFCLQLGYCDEGLAAAHEARNFYAGRDDHWRHALSLAVYSWLLAEAGLSDLAFESASEAAVIAARTDDKALNAFAMNCKAVALVICHEMTLALSVLDDAMALAAQSGDGSTVALTHINQGYAKLFLSEQLAGTDREAADKLLCAAAAASHKGADAARAIGDLWNLRVALANAAEMYAACGELTLSQVCIEEYETLVTELGPRERVHYLCSKSDIHAHMGDYHKVMELMLEAREVVFTVANHDGKINTLKRLANVSAKTGSYEDAYNYHRAYHDAVMADHGETSRRRAHALDRQLENDKLRERAAALEIQAGEDGLTGIPNRRAFDQAFAGLAHREGVVGILDIDYFKQVNDSYSHLVGDKVLIRIANILHRFDPSLRAFRFGGEEFGLVFDRLGLEHAEPICQRLVDTIRTTSFADLAPGLSVTVSIGLAHSGVLSGSPLLAEADRRLYVAKKMGRDRVIADGRSSITVAAE